MPQAVAFIAASLGTAGIIGVGATTAIIGFSTSVVGSLVLSVAGSLLLSAAANALTPQPHQPTPANVQSTLKQAVGQRLIHIGRVRAGGTIVFQREKAGNLYTVVAHGQGEIDGIEGYFLDRLPVTLDGSNNVTQAQYQNRGASKVQILHRLGVIPESAYAELTAIWPQWTVNHRLDGLWTSMTTYRAVHAQDFQAMYPNRAPSLEVLARGIKVRDPRTGTTAWTDNAALHIAHLFEDADGFNRPGMINAARLVQAANDCEDAIALAAGGTEPRYRLWGSYGLAEKPQSVLQRMLDACGGRISLLPDATIAVDVGKWRAPAVTLTTADIIELSEYSDGPDLLSRVNTQSFTYTDPSLTYQQVEGDPWVNELQLAEDGEELVGSPLALDLAPSHSQARRCAKIRQARDNPPAVYTVRCQPSAIVALFERYIGLEVPEFGATGFYEVMHYEMNLDDGSITYVLNAADPATFDWTTAEEGQAQGLPTSDIMGDIAAPAGFTAAGSGVQISALSFSAGIGCAWAAPPSSALSPRLEYATHGASNWVVLIPDPAATSYQINGLTDGYYYDVRLAFFSPSGQIGAYSTINSVIAAATTTPPATPAALTVTDLTGGSARISVTACSSANLFQTQILRGATVIATFYTAPGAVNTFTDACGAGTFNWSARSINVSNVANTTDRGPVTQTIT